MKKKILSFALACLMVMTVCVATIPAVAAGVTVNTGAELCSESAAVKSGETKTIIIGSDFTLDSASITVAAGATVIIEGENHTLSVSKDVASVSGDLTIKNLTLNLTTPMIGDLAAQGATLTYYGCTITQSGGRSADNQFCRFNANNTTLNLTSTTFDISKGGRSGGQQAFIFKVNGAYNATINMVSSSVGFTSNAQYIGAVDGIYLNAAATLNLNMADSTFATYRRAVSAQNKSSNVNITMSGNSVISSKVNNAIEANGALTLNMSGTSKVAVDNTSLTSAQSGHAVNATYGGAVSINMTDSARIEAVGAFKPNFGAAIRCHDGSGTTDAPSTKKINVTMSGNSSIYSQKFHGIHPQSGNAHMCGELTLVMYGEANITSGGGSAVYLGANKFNLYLDGNATLTKGETTSIAAVNFVKDSTKSSITMGYTAACNHAVSGTHNFQNNAAPTVIAGASVRTTEGSTGIRFTADVTVPSSRSSDIEYGMIVARYNDFNGKCAFIPAVLDANGVKYATASASDTNNSNVVTKDNKEILNFAITGLDGQESTEFAVRGYTKYNYSSSAITCELLILSDFVVEDNVRSIEYVAGEAIKDVKDAPEGDYKFEVVEDCAYKGKYSRYSSAQYKVVLGFTN